MTNIMEGSDGDFAAVQNDQAQDRDFVTLLAAFERWQDSGPVQIEIADKRSAWIVLAALQLAWKHPDAPLRAYVERFGRQVQDAVCDGEDIYRVAEAGWTEADR